MKNGIRQIKRKFTTKLFLALGLTVALLPAQVVTIFGFDDEFSKEQPLEFTSETDDSTSAAVNFYSVLNTRLVKRGWKKEDLCDQKDVVIGRIMKEYGSVFVVIDAAAPPPVCMFTSSEEVEKFQKAAGFVTREVAGAQIELQPAAMEALLKARAEALQKNLDITPRDGAEAGRRNFDDTVRLWKSRFEPACDYWKAHGRLNDEQIEKLKSLPLKDQVREVLALEAKGIYFNKFFNNSILYSVAAPGTSQHLSMLALDVNEYDNKEVRDILAKYGWFQTVRNDLPHFTFLGHPQTTLESLGLKQIVRSDRNFWVPNA